MSNSDQEITFYTVQKNRQYFNDIHRKELDELNNRQNYSIIAYPDMQNGGELDRELPIDNSIVLLNYGLNQKEQKQNEQRSIDEHQNSSRYKIIKNPQNETIQLDQKSNSYRYSQKLRDSKSGMNDSKLGMNESKSGMRDSKSAMSDSKQKSIDNTSKKSFLQYFTKKVKKPEKSAILNWRKLREIYFANKPIQQITLEQYKLINDWASNEYRLLSTEIENGNKKGNDPNNTIIKKSSSQSKKIKKNSIIESLIQVQEVIKSIEKVLFPSISSYIPLIKADSFIAFTFEIYLYILYTYFLIQNWLIVVFDLNYNQSTSTTKPQESTLLSIVFISSIMECLKNMNKQFTFNGSIISERNQIIYFYLKGNFVFDFIFIICVIYLLSSGTQIYYANIFFRVGILLKLKPYFHIHHLLRSHFEVMQGFHNILRIFDLICIFFLFTHMMSTLYFIQARIISSINDNISTWIFNNNIQNNDWVSLYFESMSRVAALMIGTKSWEYKSNNFEKGFEVFTFLMGLFLLSYFVKKSLSFLKENQKKQQKQRNEINGLISYLGQQKVSESLKLRIISYLKSYHKEEINIIRSEGTQEALQKLPDELRKELTIHTNTEHLKMLSFFDNFSNELKIQLMNIMTEKIFQPGQIIFEDGESENFSIYLINKGKVDMCYDTRRCGSKYSVVKQIQQNQAFGEISFLTGFPRKCHAISKEISSLISINREEFLKILKSSREEKDLQIFCQMRDQYLNDGDQNVLGLSCYQCGSQNHLSDQCTKTHCYIHRNSILKQISSNYKQLNRKKFKRFRSQKKKSVATKNDITKMIINFVEKHEEQINFLIEEVQMQRFCYQTSQSNSYSYSNNQIKQNESSENILPIQNSDDNLDDDSSDSNYSDNKSLHSGKSNTDKAGSQPNSEKEVDGVKSKNSITNLPGGGSKKKLKGQQSNSMNNLNSQSYSNTPPPAGSMKNLSYIQTVNSSFNSPVNLTSNSIIGNPRLSVKNSSNQSNQIYSTSHSNLSVNNQQQQIMNDEVKIDELDEYLSINNEQTIGSIFQNFDKKKNVKDNLEDKFNKKRSSQKNQEKTSISLSTFGAHPQQRGSQLQKSSKGNLLEKPKISVSCSDLDSSSGNLNLAQHSQSTLKKGSMRHSFTFNNGHFTTGNFSESRKSITQKDNESSSSTESNTTELFFDQQQLAPLTAALYSQQQLMHQTAGFEQGNIFIINNNNESPLQNSNEEKNQKKSKFDLLQEKMNNDETESTPVSLIESVYNADSHPTIGQKNNKRQGILPYSTSLSENMRKIARLYSKGSTKTSNGIGQVLNLQMLNQYTHKTSYTNPNDIASLMTFDKMKSFHYYYPNYNLEVVLQKLEKFKKENYITHTLIKH